MREIKFKAYDKIDDCVSEVINIDFGHGTVILKNEEAYDTEMYEFGYIGRNFDDVKLLEFTGLKDKNGKEIYEGDILKITPTGGGEQWTSEVYTYGTTLCINMSACDYDSTALDFAMDGDVEEIEVIGNVWENGELLNDS